MAGFGEMCSRVAAVLVFLETSKVIRVKEQTHMNSVKQLLHKNIFPKLLDLDFTSAKGRKWKIDSGLSDQTPTITKQ